MDFAPLAVEGMQRRARERSLEMRVLEADVLDLPHDLAAAFDVIWEQTCLCALYPEMREAYVASMARAIKPSGEYHGLFWNHGNEGGPPYDISPDLVDRLFSPAFEVLEHRPVAPALSVRAHEFLSLMRPR